MLKQDEIYCPHCGEVTKVTRMECMDAYYVAYDKVQTKCTQCGKRILVKFEVDYVFHLKEAKDL